MKTLTLFIVLVLFIQSTVSAQFGEPCLPEGITFSTQAHIDNFQTNYPNCTKIEGSMVISHSDITSLMGLNVLTSVGGYVNILNNDSLASLAGLENVITMGGRLWIAGNHDMTSLTGLEGLTSIGGDLQIVNNNSLTNLTGLEGLSSFGNLYITNNISLITCDVQSICNYLANPSSTVTIHSNAIGCNNPAEVANACGFTMPCLPYGNYYLLSQTDVDNFQTNYPNCTEIEGTVEIKGDDITNLNGLNVVTSIGGSLWIDDNSGLASLTGLNNLISIGGQLIIGVDDWYGGSGNPALTSLTGLDNVTSIGGDLDIAGNDSLTSLTGLDNLTSIGGNLHFGNLHYGNPSLTSLTGLDNLTSIGGGLRIGSLFNGNPSLTSLTGLDNVTSIGGSLNIWGSNSLINLSGLDYVTSIGGSIQIASNNGLTSLTGLENITSIPGTLRLGGDDWLGGNHSLTNLSGLDNLTSIGGGLSIDDNFSLESLAALEGLTSIGGSLWIFANDTLASLTGLEGLTSIQESLWIGYNDALTSLTGLDNIDAGSIKDLTINGNASLSTCEVQSICNYIANPNGEIDIQYNASGCNSQEEVEVACAVSVEEVQLAEELFIYPNPSSTQITIEIADAPQKNALLSIYNINSQQMLSSKLIEQKTVVDISSLPNGFYFAKVADDRKVMVGKVVKN